MGCCTAKPKLSKNERTTQPDNRLNCSASELNASLPTQAKPIVRQMSTQKCYFYDGHLRKVVRVPVLLPIESSSLYQTRQHSNQNRTAVQ